MDFFRAVNVDNERTVKELLATGFDPNTVNENGQVGLFLEVTDAQAALIRAENSQVDAVYNYLTARAQYENVLGIPALQQTNTLTVPVLPASTLPAAPPSTPTPTEAPAPIR